MQPRLSPLLLLPALACVPKNEPLESRSPKNGPATEQAAAAVERYLDGYLAREPDAGREAGLHAYDGKVAQASAAAEEEDLRFYRSFLAETAALPLAELSDPTRLDLQLTRLSAERHLFQIEVLKRPRHILAWNALFDVSPYLVREYAPLPDRVARLLDHVQAATAQVDGLLAMVQPRQPRTHVETALKVWKGLGEYYQGDVKAQVAPALAADPALAARYAQVIPAGLAAVDKVVRWLETEALKNATEDFAIGEQAFLRMLEVNEGLKISLADLEQTAQQDFQRNHDAFVEVAKKIDPRLSTRQVADKVASERLPKDQVIATARRQLEQLLLFIHDKDLITIPTEERAKVEVTPPFKRWNSAFLDMGGPFETVAGSYYYLSPPDPSWPADMQEQYIPYEGDLLSTSTHEVYPGHFVQGHHQRLAKTRAQKILDSYAFVEGWAHYAEEVMFEAGFGGDDQRLKLGQLSNALLRNCRFLAAIGLHVKGMKVSEAEQLFKEQCFIDPGNAKQQAYRGTFDPGYLSYTLGKLQIMSLRKDFMEKRGTSSLRAFHDWLLSFGAAPVALVRERL